MPNIIEISGIIGLDVTPTDVRKALSEANGQPIEAEIASPGGLVVDGIEIYNLFRMYKGQTTARIMALAGSMSAIIPLAFDKIEAFSNSIYFLHQAITSIRDANKDDLEKRIRVLNGFDNILISALMSKSGKQKAEIEMFLKNDTFMFGGQILQNGFADVMLDSDADLNEQDAVTNAMTEFYACQEKIKDHTEDYSKVAAFLNIKNEVTEKPGATLSKERTGANSNSKPKDKMDLDQFLAENPAAKVVYDKRLSEATENAKAEGHKAGVEAKQNEINRIHPLISAKGASQALVESGFKALKGESSVDSFVAIADYETRLKEEQNAQAATEEQQEDTETAQVETEAKKKEGKVASAADIKAENKLFKQNDGGI